MDINSEVFKPEGRGPSEHPGSDQCVEGAVCVRFPFRTMRVLLTHRHRRAGRVTKPLTPLGGSPAIQKSPSAVVSRNPSTRDVTSETSVVEARRRLPHEGAEGTLELSPPRTPTKRSSREELVNDVLDLTDQVASTVLFGSIGVGKSFMAHTILHHDRTKAKFGGNRHFVLCDNFTNSLDGFLEHLSNAISTNRTRNTERLGLYLESSPPLILLLDGVDLILDPLSPEAEAISATIEELGSYPHVCLVTTSRMDPDIHGFHRVKIPVLSKNDAQDTFHSLCNLGRSPAVDDLIAKLDFHPLSIELLARSVRENEWDEPTLLKALDGGQTSVLKEKYYRSLKDATELSFRSPTIQNLGTTARRVLEVIAAYPGGVEERRMERKFPGITGVEVTVDVLCRFSLTYQQGGFVKMLSPFRFYFLESTLTPAQHTEVICWDSDCSPAPGGMSTSHDVLCGHCNNF